MDDIPILPLGSVVKLKNGKINIMVISRTPLSSQNGTIGYFDYGACLYPRGMVTPEVVFFNQEDIEEILFVGYRDSLEDAFCEKYCQEIKTIKYPKLTTNT